LLEDFLSDFSENNSSNKDSEFFLEEECELVPSKSLGKNMYTYMPSHPLYATHAAKFKPSV